MVAEIVAEMDYLRTREQKLRDTNESTNTRVKWFAFATMGMLVALGVWQIVYLRAYFRYIIQFLCVKYLISNLLQGQSISFRSSDGYIAKKYGRRKPWHGVQVYDNGLTSVTVGVGNKHIMTIHYRARDTLEKASKSIGTTDLINKSNP
jgi:hypothetical protein